MSFPNRLRESKIISRASRTYYLDPIISQSPVIQATTNLTWTDNATNEDGFEIERCKGSTCTTFAQIATVGANVTTFANTGLAKNTTCRYRVRAYNAAGNSGYSNVASATTPRR